MALTRSADQIQKFAYAIVGFILFVGGGVFAWYLWNGTNVKTDDVVNDSIRGDIKLKPSMTVVVEERPGQGLAAVVTMTNSTSTRMVMPETVIPEPLYKLSLKFGPKGAPPFDEVRPFGLGNNDTITVADAIPTVLFDPKNDAVIELLPSHTHSLTIPLQTRFRLNPGNYELTVKFQPLSVELTDGSPGAKFNVEVCVGKVTFSVPLSKGTAPEAPEPPASKKSQDSKDSKDASAAKDSKPQKSAPPPNETVPLNVPAPK